MTIKEIAQKTGIDQKYLQETYEAWGKLSSAYVMSTAYHQMTKKRYEAYCYLWRNMCVRFSTELIEYQL